MADDKPEVHFGENSPEYVAMKMAHFVLFSIESKPIKTVTRKEFLDTFVECLDAVKGNRPRPR